MLTSSTTLLLTIIDILLFILVYVIISWLSSLIILGVDEHHLPLDMVLKYTLRCILLTPIIMVPYCRIKQCLAREPQHQGTMDTFLNQVKILSEIRAPGEKVEKIRKKIT